MGQGLYSSTVRNLRATNSGYYTKSANEIFTQKNINSAMNPSGVKIRESRDSAEHPNSVAVIIALDVTGSMGSVPHYLVKNGLPDIMQGMLDAGIADPQVLFLGIGDHACDRAPLQVGQFESGDELLDKWLTTVYLEGGGGGNEGESYLLAWYFAACHTSIDCLEKRGVKGILITIGDEPVLSEVSANDLRQIMGDGQYEKYRAPQLLDMAREKYHVYHLNIAETYSGGRKEVLDGWRQIMGDNVINIQDKSQIAAIIPDIIKRHYAGKPSMPAVQPKTEVIL